MADHVAGTLAREAQERAIGTRTTAILFPLRLEARPFLKRVGHAESAAFGRLIARRVIFHGNDFLIVHTGVGPLRTMAALDALSARVSLDTVISAGFAGALAPEFGVGDVIAATHVIDDKLTSTQATWLPPGVRQGRILTMTRVIGDPAEKRELCTRYQAAAVDMESEFIGRWCVERGIRFGVVRAITDDAETSIAPAVARLVSNERWSITSGVLGMAREPQQSLHALWRLRRNALIAGERLAEVLCCALQSPCPQQP
jgi:adenosylhomocysteine nucleosidase